MTEFWEANFIEKQEMWGFEPAHSAVLKKDFFIQKAVKNILIPGIGYGRNAKAFTDNGITVDGIEISKTAIQMAERHYGTDMVIHHGPTNRSGKEGIRMYKNERLQIDIKVFNFR